MWSAWQYARGLNTLIERVLGRDTAAFEEVVGLYDADIVRLCYVIGADQEVARDATQTAWQRLWDRPPRLRDDTKLRPWLCAVAANETRQILRRRSRGRDLEAAVDPPAVPGDASVLDLRRALATLDLDARELLGLRYALGFSSDEIARHLGISPTAARSRLHRLLVHLRAELEP